MPIDHATAERMLHEWMSDRVDRVVDLALATRKRVHKTALSSGHESSELLYCGYCVSDVFSFSGKLGQAYIHIATYANHVNLGFNYGVDLPDPKKILEGTGKSIRHFKLNSLSDLETKPVTNLIEAAVAHGLELATRKSGIQQPALLLNKKKS